MKRYLLLRENQEFGPYTIEDLRQKGLRSYDLIWIEGQGTRWMYPSEIMELSDIPVSRSARRGTIRSSFTASPAVTTEETKTTQPVVENFRTNTSSPVANPYADALEKELYVTDLESRKFTFQNSFSRSSGLWIVGLMLVLISSAVVVKNIVENFEENPYKDAESAVAPVAITDDMAHSYHNDQSYQIALTTEIVAVDTVVTKPEKKKKSAKELKKNVSIKANEFKSGLLGGINDLELTVKNGSEEKLDVVTVEVKFLKPNGEVLRTDQFDVNKIPAGGSKVLEVPDSKRGAKIQYKIVGVKALENKTALRDA